MQFGRISGQRPAIVVGEFDGFHLGHRQLLHGAIRVAQTNGQPLVAVILRHAEHASLLTIDERCRATMVSGASNAIAVEVLSPSAPDVGRVIVDEIVSRLDPSTVVMACLPGNASTARFPNLRAEFVRRGVDLIEMPRWCNPDGEPITSSGIRAALRRGAIAQANDWLGRTFTLTGRVVHGSGLGRTIGFPTANLDLADPRTVPMHGVYAAEVRLPNNELHRAAVNIGVRPTVEDHGALLVEAHLLDFDADLYGDRIQVGFRRWLRDEQRFDSVDALVGQLAVDVEQVRLMLRAAT